MTRAFYNNKDIQQLTNFGYRKCLSIIGEVNKEAERRGLKILSRSVCSAVIFEEIYGIKKEHPKTDKGTQERR